MLTLEGEEKPARSSVSVKIGIVLFVIAGIFVPAVLLPKVFGPWFGADFFGGLVVGLPALALLAYVLGKTAVKNHYGDQLRGPKKWRRY